MIIEPELKNSLLGKDTEYKDTVDTNLLFAIPRRQKQKFLGVDIWNCFEFSWLDANSTPQFAALVITIPASSPKLIESKSLKLYLYSFANSQFKSIDQLINRITDDLNSYTQDQVIVELFKDFSSINKVNASPNTICIDNIEINCDEYQVNPRLLKIEDTNTIVTENLYSNLMRSNCLVTGKPDWATIQIEYTGKKICHKSLLEYIISYREHQGFHEQCVEQVYLDFQELLTPEKLTVTARYTRRGSLDINPIRTNHILDFSNERLYRQ